MENFLTVSWENVGFDGFTRTNFNAQITLYPNGNVDLCWGEGWSDRPLRAIIWDSNNNLAFPVNTGPPFQEDGSFDIDWPTQQCRFFCPNNDNSGFGWFPTQACPGPTCETAIEAPFHNSGSLTDGSDTESFSLTCSRYLFDSEQNDVVWYKVEGDGDCACIELRSMDNAFTVGVFSSPDSSGCNSLSCVDATDFTSASIVWRSAPDQTYWIGVSAFPGSIEGRYTLSVTYVEGDNTACPEMPNESAYVSGSCLAL